jgi:hypothetical protein
MAGEAEAGGEERPDGAAAGEKPSIAKCRSSCSRTTMIDASLRTVTEYLAARSRRTDLLVPVDSIRGQSASASGSTFSPCRERVSILLKMRM